MLGSIIDEEEGGEEGAETEGEEVIESEGEIEEIEDVEAVEGEEGVEKQKALEPEVEKAKTADGRLEDYTDESEIEDELLANISDEDLEKILHEAYELEFETAEEAMNYVKEKLGH